jgi:uncharacterized coiled-coil protein SlyX
MNMINFIKDNWVALLAPISSLLTYIFVKRKYQKKEIALKDKDIEGATIKNVTANFKVYQDLINDLEIRFKNRIDELELDLDKMKELNNELRKAVARQEKYINKLQLKLDKYESSS